MDSHRHFFQDAFLLEISSPTTATWKPLACFPYPIFSHACVAVRLNERCEVVVSESATERPTHVAVIGGCSLLCRNQVFLLSLEHLAWSSLALQFCSLDENPDLASTPNQNNSETRTSSSSTTTTISLGKENSSLASSLDSQLMLARHTATLVHDRLYIIGGGGLCFSFGVHFNPLCVLSFAARSLSPLQYVWTASLSSSNEINGKSIRPKASSPIESYLNDEHRTKSRGENDSV
jgi:hypothetical protein